MNADLHDVYDPAANSWQPAKPLPTARSGVAAALYQGFVVVAGGECRNRSTFVENEAYDPKAGRWLKLAPMPAGRHGFGAAVVGGSLYFPGGALDCGGGRVSDELLVFTLP